MHPMSPDMRVIAPVIEDVVSLLSRQLVFGMLDTKLEQLKETLAS